MSDIQFGGTLGAFHDAKTNVNLSPRCFGAATVPFESNDAFTAAARAAILKHLAIGIHHTLQGGGQMWSLLTKGLELLGPAASAAVSAELGVQLTIGSLNLTVSDDERAALTKAFAAGAQEARAAKMREIAAAEAAQAARPPTPVAPPASTCSRCGSPGPGKFCAQCGGPMAAPGAPINSGPIVQPDGEWLAAGTPKGAIAAGTQVTVRDGFVFVGVINRAVAFQSPAGTHPIAACDAGVFVRLAGLPFSFTGLVANRGRSKMVGTWYVQDPGVLAASVTDGSIGKDDFGILEIVLGRSADFVSASARSEQELCAAIARQYQQDGDDMKGTMVVVNAMTPA